jgi:surface protein
MAKNNNLTDLLADIADAIREKKGTSGPINPQDFSSEIASIETGGGNTPMWTGHADAEGLRAIGWTDEDIAYYQEHGVNWNAEDDEYHKVSDDNKALYGVLTADNITSYRARIVYLPKIDTSRKTSMSKMFYNCTSLVSIPQLDTQNVTNMNNMFQSCTSLVSIPQLDTQNVTNMSYMFNYCYSLVSIPQLDTQNVTSMSGMFQSCTSLVSIPQLDTQKVMNMSYMFNNCYSLVSIPQFDTQKVMNMSYMFQYCYSLVSIPQLDTQNVTNMNNMFQNCNSLVSIPQLDTQNVTNMSYMFNYCYSLVSIPQLDTQNVTNMSYMFDYCYSLTNAYLKNVKLAYQLNSAALLSKESLLYLINNEAATSAITIKLAGYAYTRLANDADIVAALAAHPNISISQ